MAQVYLTVFEHLFKQTNELLIAGWVLHIV